MNRTITDELKAVKARLSLMSPDILGNKYAFHHSMDAKSSVRVFIPQADSKF